MLNAGLAGLVLVAVAAGDFGKGNYGLRCGRLALPAPAETKTMPWGVG